MNDDARLTPAELASAYLDGELDPSARALFDASPEAQHLAAVFADVRRGLAEPVAVDEHTRDLHLATALDAWHVPNPTGVPSAPRSNVIGIEHRRRTWVAPLLKVAAGIAAVGALGAVIVSNSGGDNKSSSATFAPSAASVGSAAAPKTPSTDGAAGDAMTATQSVDSMASTESTAAASRIGTQPTIGSITGAAEAMVALYDDEQLRDFVLQHDSASNAGGAAQSTTAAGTGNPFDCPLTATQSYVAQVLWHDQPALAVLDAGAVLAIGTDCAVLATVAL